MQSGSDSADSQKHSKWTVNSTAYQNMANDQVDWAAIAQQWIIMKEAGPPPVPGEQQVDLNKNKKNQKPEKGFNEGGEAPMEVDEKEDAPSWSSSSDPPPPPGAESWSNWSSSGNQNWNWNSTWGHGVPVPPPGVPMKTLLPTPSGIFSTPPESGNDNAVPFGNYNTAPPTNEFNTGYWTSGPQQKEIKPHNKRYSKVNVPIKAPIRTPPAVVPIVTDNVQSSTSNIDANKRKQLPAWIREGLEKMEKDKMKQLEKDRERIAQEEYSEKIKQTEKEKMEILKSTMKEQQQKSKFDSDNETSDQEVDKRKVAVPPVTLSPEDLMTKVRKTMTEILLKVTNQLIEQTCKEEHQRYLKKARDQRTSAPSGAILSAKLGLGVYNDDTSSSGEESDEANGPSKDDSDQELKETIKKKMLEFTKIEKEIEDMLAASENHKEETHSGTSSVASNEIVSQVDAPAQGRRRQSTEESPPSYPNNYNRSSSSSSESSNYLTSKAKDREASSSSTDSYSKSRRRDKSRSKSRTPEKKYKRSDSWHSKSSPKKRSRSRSSRRNSDEIRKRRRRSSSRQSRKSRRSKTRSPSRHRTSLKRTPRSYRSRSRSRSSRYSSRKARYRSKSRSRSRRRSRSSSGSRGKRSRRR